MNDIALGKISRKRKFKGVARKFETRIIVLALGIENHIEDTLYWGFVPAFRFLRKKFGKKKFKIAKGRRERQKILIEHDMDGFERVRQVGRYTSDEQRVKFVIVTTVSKRDFKKALKMEGPPFVHVIYAGHSRYGRGACFDTYTGRAPQHGDQWGGETFYVKEPERFHHSGLFRLGYPYVPIPLEDIRHHEYHFAPVPVEGGAPPSESQHPFSRHPDARKPLERITLPFKLRQLVWYHVHGSSTNRYFGYTKRKKEKLPARILLHAGWNDLRYTNLKCKTFCHFGCSSRRHFWKIVRRAYYGEKQEKKPSTDRYACFTKAPSDDRAHCLWLYHLLAYNERNDFKPWWKSLEYAEKKTNRKLKSVKAGYQIWLKELKP